MAIVKDDHALPDIISGSFDGLVYDARLTLHGARLSCWAKARDAKLSHFLLLSRGKTIGRVEPVLDHENPDLFYGHFDIELYEIPAPLDCRFDVFAVTADDHFCCLLLKQEGLLLDQVVVRSYDDFARLIQNPASRFNDETMIFYGAFLAAQRLPDDYEVFAGAICVVGYRLLHNFKCEPEISEVLDNWIERFIRWESHIQAGKKLRWQVSVNLLAAYRALKAQEFVKAEEHLLFISNKASDLRLWPSQLTNILLSFYGLGYMAHGRSDEKAALAYWEQAETTFREGAGHALFPNDYSYGELGNALKVARECHVGRFIIESGGSIRNQNIAAIGTILDPKRLPAPLGWLLPSLAAFSRDALIETARRSSREQDWKQAIIGWATVRHWFPDDPIGFSRGGDALREILAFNEAEAVLLEGVTRFRADIDLARAYARLAEVRANWSEAVERWQAAISLDPNDAAFWAGLINALAKAGRFQETISESRNALDRFPHDVNIKNMVSSLKWIQ